MKQIVYAYVCGDILHKGHLLALENAKRLGDILIVGVLTDEAVMERKKKPIISFEARLQLVKALECVDVAIPQAAYSPSHNVQGIKPQVLMESESHTKELLEEVRGVMSEWGGRVIVMPYYPGCSSTQIKKEIQDGE